MCLTTTYRLESNRRIEKMHNEGLHKSYSSPYIIIMLKSRRRRWARHVPHTGWEIHTKFWFMGLNIRPCGRFRHGQ
jgi:hypothetical protein